MKQLTKQQKIEFVIKNWDRFSTIDISKRIGVNSFTVSKWAERLRMRGIDLPRKWPGGKGEPIDWDYFEKKYGNKKVLQNTERRK